MQTGAKLLEFYPRKYPRLRDFAAADRTLQRLDGETTAWSANFRAVAELRTDEDDLK